MSELFGVLVIDKPEGVTSHDVINRLRLQLKTGKIGHLGTLDPMATGVLPVCVGKATRLGLYFECSPKEYTGTIRLGFSTTTYDRQGEPTSEPGDGMVSEESLKQAIERFIGEIDQVPPAYSAKKIGGVPSYKFARRGRVIANAAARVRVDRFDILHFEPPLAKFRIVCGPGTYVRSLAHDLGQALGCGAHLSSLRRERSGIFDLDQAIAADEAGIESVMPIDRFLSDWPRIDADSDDQERKVIHGNPIPSASSGRFARIFNKRGEFIAVAALENGWAYPRVVLTSVGA